MSASHHPSEAVLTAYACGSLADGPGLTVAAHLEGCVHCRGLVGTMEAVGGALMAELEPSAMHAQALDLALARIERPAEPRRVASAPVKTLEGWRLPAALQGRKIGPRLWIAPGLWFAHVHSNAPDGWRTYLLRAGKGQSLPEHGHRGLEVTAVLHGAFGDGIGQYGAGDFCEAAEELQHQPEVVGDQACLCLISAKGGMRAKGIAGLLQPLLRV